MKKIAVLLAVFVLGLAGAREWVPLAAGAPERTPEFRVISSNLQRTIVELELSGFYVEPTTIDGQVFQRLELGMTGGASLREVGSPELPAVARLIQIPDDKEVHVRVLETEAVSLWGYAVYPAQPPLPENVSSLPFTIDAKRYSTNELYPTASFRVTEPMIMRDVRVVQLVLQPVQTNPVTGELKVARRLRVELSYSGRSSINVLNRTRVAHSRTFVPLYKHFIPNYDGPPVRPEDGSYLIIVNDAFVSAVQPFADWKRQKGWRTKVVTISEIGGNDTARIWAYINNAYRTWPYPPDHVLLVGDAPEYIRCNRWPGHTDASDLYYSLHAGSDILADLMIARVNARTLTEAQTMLNKLYRYEKEPYLGNTQWFNKVCALAAYESSQPNRFWTVVIRIRNYVLGRPFAQFDTLFERWGLNTAQRLTDSLNQGRSWMLYRGHGEEQGWANVNPSWYNANVAALNNAGMPPVVIGPTCLSGDFDYPSGDCHAEAWLKAGTPEISKGGCGYFGSSEVSYSGYNDSLAAGSFLGYVDSLHYGFAQSTQFGKLFMLRAYPLPDQITEEEIYMFNNFGDPELNMWSATPRTLSVNYPPTVLIGSFPFSVSVNANDAPVAGALVCVMSRQDTTIYHVGHTDASGQVNFTINATLPGDSLLVTVTGRNLLPHLGSALTIAPNSAYVTYLRHIIDDSAGNNDGIVNPGETIELPVWLKNWGSLAASNVSATLRSADPNVTITDSIKNVGTIAPGDSAYTGTDGFTFTPALACTNGYALRFTLEARDANDSIWTSTITIWVGTPIVSYVGNVVDDPPPGGNGNGKIDPGETANLIVTLRNSGLGHAYNVSAVLRSGDARFVIQDSVGTLGTILRDSTGTNASQPFRVFASAAIPREVTIPCTLLVRADGGYERRLAFGIMIGQIRQVDPIPDSGGTTQLYWAYDNADSFYVQAPRYSWFDITGLGTRLTLSDDQTVPVSLPPAFGPFRFYNQNYTTVSVCSNGWLGLGSTTTSTYTNTRLPNTSLPPAFFGYWDDLYPPTGNGVWWYHDAANHRFIVQFDSVPLYRARTSFQKFQIILYDTTLAAADGNCQAVIQYAMVNDPSSCTVGEQDHTRTVAIQCLFDGSYHRGAMPLAAGLATKYSTDAPSTGVAEPAIGLARTVPRMSILPNPVRQRTFVHFSLPATGLVRIAVYDRSGRQLHKLLDAEVEAGDHQVGWDGCDSQGRRLAQGVYFVRLETKTCQHSVKTLLLQ